jgi:dihydroorotase
MACTAVYPPTAAARVRVFSDDGHCVSDAVLMRRALEYVKAFGGVIAQHAQEPRLTVGAQMHEGELSGVLGLAGWPAVAEEAIIARDVLLAELGAMATSAAGVRIFSDDGHCVADPRLMRRALEYVKAFDGIIAQHAEEPRLTEGAQMHEGEVSTRLGLTGWPAVAEEAIIARDVLLAEHVGSRLHVCHVSTAGSVEVLRQAKARGVRVTAEVTPHHLLLTDELAASYDPVYKVNPPLRTASDVAALREALVEGVIDIVATDHAPHAVEDKECEWAYARPGMVGLETALPVVLSVLGEQWELIAERMSRAPARIAGLAGHGTALAAGAPANLTLVDPSARRVVDPGELASRSRNTPYAGTTLPGRIVATFLRGEPTVLDGKAVK